MAYQDISVSELKIRIFKPDSEQFDTLIYIPVSDPNEIDTVIESFEDPFFSVAAVECNDWDNLLTPWKAPAAFRGNREFGGHADNYLKMIENDIIPAVEAITGTPAFRGIAGYSLAGLFSLYAFYRSDMFCLCGCVSGSVWYEGFEDWILERSPVPSSGSIYFSLGNKEEKTRNFRMQNTGKIMKNIAERLNDTDSYEAIFKYTKGNHFEGYVQRMNDCLSWLLGM